MAMRRSRLKFAPNIGARARGPATAASPKTTPPAIIKTEVPSISGDKNQKAVVQPDTGTVNDAETTPNLKSQTTNEPITKMAADEVEVPTGDPDTAAHTVIKPRTSSVSSNETDTRALVANENENHIASEETNVQPANKSERIVVVTDRPVRVLTASNNIGGVVSEDALKVVSRITPIMPKEEKQEKPSVPMRVRSRFPKARPNLTDTGRGRVRHNSVSQSDQSDNESMHSPPAIQRTNIVRSRQASICETIPSPQKAQAATTAEQKQSALIVEPSRCSEPAVPEPATTSPIATPTASSSSSAPPRIPNTNNSLGIDLGANTITKRTMKMDKDDESRKKPKRMERITGPVDRSKITMRDLIHMNPISNPMKSSIAEKERRKKMRAKKRAGEGGEDLDDTQSMVSTATLNEERGNLDELEISIDDGAAPKPEPKPEPELVPQVRIGVNGEIILNESSLFIANSDPDETKAESMEVVHENDFSLPTFAYGRKTSSKLWSDMETKKFYLALSAVGTDFSLMGSLFPKRTRTELKRKFKREEKTNRYLVDKAIREQQHFDQEFFDNLAKLEIDEPIRKSRKKRSRSTDDSEEDQENRSTAEKPKSVTKDKNETEGPAEKKKGRRVKKEKDTDEEADNEDEADKAEVVVKKERPKRKAPRRKGLTYEESDEEILETATDVVSTPSCSSAVTAKNTPGTQEAPEAAKRCRGRRSKNPTKEEKTETSTGKKNKAAAKDIKGAATVAVSTVIAPTTDASVVSAARSVGIDVTPLTDLVETNVDDSTEEEPHEASYVVVASTPQPEVSGSSTDQIMHVYLVSPKGADEQSPKTPNEEDIGKLLYPPTSADENTVSTTEGETQKDEGNTTGENKEELTEPVNESKAPASVSVPDMRESANNESVASTDPIAEATLKSDEAYTSATKRQRRASSSRKKSISEPTTPQEEGQESNKAEKSKESASCSPRRSRRTSSSHKEESKIDTIAKDIVSTCTTNTSLTVPKDHVPIEKGSVSPTRRSRRISFSQREENQGTTETTTIGSPSKRGSRRKSGSQTATESASNTPVDVPVVQGVNSDDLSSTVKSATSRRSETKETSNRQSIQEIRETGGDVGKAQGETIDSGNSSTNQVQAESATTATMGEEKQKIATPAAPASGGRRRRITAMPKLPVGKRRTPSGATNRPASAPTTAIPEAKPAQSIKPAAVEDIDSAEPPMDDLTAGGILLAMSSGKSLQS